MNEIGAIENWIHDVMMADAEFVSVVGNRWWKYRAKQATSDIYGVYSLHGGDDTNGNKVTLLTRPVYWCRVITKGFPTVGFDLAANRLDQKLNHVSLAIGTDSDETTRYAISSQRVRLLSYDEDNLATKEFFTHVGGLYRLEVSQLI